MSPLGPKTCTDQPSESQHIHEHYDRTRRRVTPWWIGRVDEDQGGHVFFNAGVAFYRLEKYLLGSRSLSTGLRPRLTKLIVCVSS